MMMHLLFAVALVLFPGRANASVTTEPIRIGHVDALTGQDAPYGKAADNGIQLAIEETNRAGGIRGRKLELISLDDRGMSSEAVTAATKLVTQQHVVALLGESTSSKALAMAPLAQSYHVPMISPWATNVKVTQSGDYIFRICFIDSFQGAILAKFAMDTLHAKKVALLRDINSEASLGLAKYFVERFKAMGGTIAANETYTAGDLEFRPQLTRVRESQPDAVFLTGYYAEAGLIARQARELGIKSPLFGGDGWDSESLLSLGGKALEGAYFSTHYSSQNSAKEVKDFVTAYQAKFHSVPSAPAALGYDAAKILIAAIEKSPQGGSEEIRKAIAATTRFPGVTGSISINADRNAVKPATIVQIKNGKFTYYKTMPPEGR